MGENSKIEWTDATWNPIRARLIADTPASTKKDPLRILPAGTWGYHCERISPGCSNCYACTMNGRTLPAWGTGLDYTVPNREKVEIYLDEQELMKPFGWKKPRNVFVCSMTDLYGEWVPDELIDRVSAVMALCPQHDFQVLTKRSKRLREYVGPDLADKFCADDSAPARIMAAMNVGAAALRWPLPNVWLGVSCEDQQRADERIPDLLATPAAVRFLSVEPLFGHVTLEPHIGPDWRDGTPEELPHIDWVIVGGESGPGARPCNVAWIRSIVEQCKPAGVGCFVKQVGSHPVLDNKRLRLKDRKGGDLSEPPLPPDLNVREFPDAIQRHRKSEGQPA